MRLSAHRLLSKEHVNLLLSLGNNGVKTGSLQLGDALIHNNCRIGCACQHIVFVLIPNGVAVCNFVLDVGNIQCKAQTCGGYRFFVLFLYLLPCIGIFAVQGWKY